MDVRQGYPGFPWVPEQPTGMLKCVELRLEPGMISIISSSDYKFFGRSMPVYTVPQKILVRKRHDLHAT